MVLPAEFVQRGRILVEQAQHQEAVRVCRLGLLANPGEIEGRLVLGSALMALGRYDEVLAEMRQALEMDARSASAMAMKGEALWRKGDPVQARHVLGQAGEIAPRDPYVARLRDAVESDLARPVDRTGTIDIDPEIEGVEIRGSAVHGPAGRDPDSAMEIQSVDLEPMSEEKPSPLARGWSAAAAAPARLGPPLGSPPIERRPSFGPPPSLDDDIGRERVSRSGVIDGGGGPSLDALFAGDDEGGVSGLHTLGPELDVPRKAPAVDPLARTAMAPPAGRPDPSSDDMRTIRAGLNLSSSGQSRGKAPARSRKAGKAKNEAPRRRGLPLWLYLGIAGAVIAGGVYGGFELREIRLGRQIDSARVDAAALAKDGSYRGAVAARELYERIHDADDSDASRADLALAEARLAAEFGARRAEAQKAVAALGDTGGATAAAARGYLALSEGDHAALRTAAGTILAADADSALAHYLTARAELLAGRPAAAAAAAAKAIAAEPSAAAHLTLARAEAARGKLDAAGAALDQAETLVPGHPLVAAWRARLVARSGGAADAALTAALVEAVTAAQDERAGPGAGAWAALAQAELALAGGDAEAAKKAAAQAAALWPGSDPAFAEGLADLQLALGDAAAAQSVAERAATAWPDRGRVLLAQVALARGDDAAAQTAVAAAGDAAFTTPRALATRGRVALSLGDLDAAAADLDAALAARPTLRDALVARARVDVATGDAKAALGRLEPIATEADPEARVVYAQALRSAGDTAKARRVLAPLTRGKSARADALLELAAVELAGGDFRGARRAYSRAIERAPESIDARLGAARLAIDTGDAERARELADALVADAPRNARVVVEAARIRTLAGDAEGALALLEQAGDAPSPLSWALARERGRALSRRLQATKAVAELERAISLEPDDAETRVLLMEALLQTRDEKEARRALQDITKAFRDQPVRSLAAGLHALASERADQASSAFVQALAELKARGARPREVARAHYWIGRSHELAGKLEDAVAELQKAVKLDPTHADAYYWLGQIDFMLQKPDEMVRHYEKSIAIDPGANPLAHFFLGQQYASAGKADAAKKALETFLERWPEDDDDLTKEARALLATLKK